MVGFTVLFLLFHCLPDPAWVCGYQADLAEHQHKEVKPTSISICPKTGPPGLPFESPPPRAPSTGGARTAARPATSASRGTRPRSPSSSTRTRSRTWARSRATTSAGTPTATRRPGASRPTASSTTATYRGQTSPGAAPPLPFVKQLFPHPITQCNPTGYSYSLFFGLSH